MSRLKQLRLSLFEGVVGPLAAPRSVIGAAVMTALGIGLFVAISGLSVTSTRQVADDFDALRATEVRIAGSGADGGSLWIPATMRTGWRPSPDSNGRSPSVDTGRLP